MGVVEQCHAPDTLPPGKTRYPLYRRLGGSQGWSVRVQKILPPPGFNSHNIYKLIIFYISFISYQHTRNATTGLSRLYMQPPNNNFHVLLTFYRFYHTTTIMWTFYLLLLLSCNFNSFNNFVTLASTRLRLPEDNADASQHVGVLMIHKILLIYICCAFVGLGNKLYTMHSTYIRMIQCIVY